MSELQCWIPGVKVDGSFGDPCFMQDDSRVSASRQPAAGRPTGSHRRRTVLTTATCVLFVTGVLFAAGQKTALAAGTLFVNGNPTVGSDSAACTQAAPCLTIQHAIGVAPAGSTIFVSGPNGSFNGIYCQQISIDEDLTLNQDASNPGPIVDGGGATSGNQCSSETPGRSVVTVGDVSGTTITAAIMHVTIRNGTANNNPSDGDNGPGAGGGIFCTRA